MKTFGGILFTVGIIATLITGVMVIQQTESISILGLDIVVSQGNYIPLIISALVMITGIVVMMAGRGARTQP